MLAAIYVVANSFMYVPPRCPVLIVVFFSLLVVKPIGLSHRCSVWLRLSPLLFLDSVSAPCLDLACV